MMNEDAIFAIRRPDPTLLKLYVIRSVLSGPFVLLTLPVYLFRYFTLHYHFDDKGISMRWGYFFRREVNLTYSRIQDIHLVSGLIQRWLGLADIMIQTASGNSDAEMRIEGLPEYEDIRHFLYTRMRGYADLNRKTTSAAANAGEPPIPQPAGTAPASAETLQLLREIRDELQAARTALAERRSHPSA